MNYDGFQLLKTRIDQGVAFVTIDHPPLNLLDRALRRIPSITANNCERR